MTASQTTAWECTSTPALLPALAESLHQLNSYYYRKLERDDILFGWHALVARKKEGVLRLADTSPELDCRAMAHPTGPSRGVLIRDLIIFQGKLWLDGIKDIVLSPISTGAAILDILSGPRRDGSLRFYRVMKLGERFDLWLNLFGAAKVASNSREGLFAGSEPGDNTMLGALEQLTERPSNPSERHLPHRISEAHGRLHS